MKLNQAIGQLHKAAEAAKVSELEVSEFMTPPEVKIGHDFQVFAAVQALSAHKATGAPVVDRQGRMIGMISEYDLLMQAATRDLSSPIEFNREVISLPPTATLRECLILLYKKKIRRIPIVDQHNNVVGMVSRIDVLNRLIKSRKTGP